MGLIPTVLAALIAISGGLGFYANHLRGEVQEQRDLVVSKEETITGLRADVAERDLNITGLRADVAERDLNITDLLASRDTVNMRLRVLITDNNAAIAAEVERRRLADLERDKAKEALEIALNTIATESERDESFAAWLAQPVPRAAWDRLRAAAE